MAHVLDLNLIEQPTLELKLHHPESQTIRVTLPDTDLIQEFMARDDQKNLLLASGNKDGIVEIYDHLARLLSCNLEGITFTGEELLSTYKINLYALRAIMDAYRAFIADIEKN